MKTAYFAIFALLLLSVRADDAEKLGFKCPVNSKFLKERIDPEKYERVCLKGKPTGKNCDTCFEFIIKSIERDYLSTVGTGKFLNFIIDSDPKYTFEEKMRAAAEGCAVKLKKAMDGKVNKKKLNQALKYPNGDLYKCPWDATAYPKTMRVLLEVAGPLLGPLIGN